MCRDAQQDAQMNDFKRIIFTEDSVMDAAGCVNLKKDSDISFGHLFF